MSPLLRILLVDDSEDARMIVRAALEDGAFARIDNAGSAQEAYERLRIDTADPDLPPDYDLILLDILMPGVDGVEACATIRSTRRYRDVPILMVSGQSDRETLNQAFIAGANDYVAKPLNPLELLARARSALRFKREIDRRRAREAALRIGGEGQPGIAGGFDLDSGLPDRAMVEARIAAAAETMRRTALLLIGIDGFARLRSEEGEAAAAGLQRRMARELGALPAPLGALFGLFGEGQFMAVADGAPGGARALEAYPITTTNVIVEELHVGLERVFADAGLTVVSRPTTRRCVMRIDFPLP